MESSFINGKSAPFIGMHTSSGMSQEQYFMLKTDVLDSLQLTVLDKNMQPATTVKSIAVVLRFEETDK